MDSMLNQPAEDISDNNIIMNVFNQLLAIEAKKAFMVYMYDSLTRNKCELHDYHWNVRDKDPSFEVNEKYFRHILSLQSILRKSQKELDQYAEELKELQEKAVGKSWKYIV